MYLKKVLVLSPDGEWKGENSFSSRSTRKKKAIELAKEFEQNTIVFRKVGRQRNW